jgi:hypothetical protein
MIQRANGAAHSHIAGRYFIPCGNFLYKFPVKFTFEFVNPWKYG